MDKSGDTSSEKVDKVENVVKVEKTDKVDDAVTVEGGDTNASNEKVISTKKKATTGVYFSDIPKDVRVSEFKNKLRERDVKLVFVKWKAFKQSAIVFFEDELDVVVKNLSGLTLHDEVVKFEEIVPKAATERETVKKNKKSLDKAEKNVKKDESGESRRRRRRSTREDKEDTVFPDVDKAKKRTNRKEQRMKKREDFGGKFGIFVGKIPKGVTKDDLGEEFAKLNVPVPDYVDWVVKKGHAFAFWREADSSLNLDVFAGITVAGVALHVELYDSNRTKIKDEKKDEEADLKKSPNVDKKVRDVSEKKGTPEGNREYKIENMTVKSEEPKKKDEAGLPKKTAVSKPKEEVVAKLKTSEHKHSEKPPTKSPTPSKNSHETKKHSAKSPETATKGKHPKKDAPDSASTKSPNKTSSKTSADSVKSSPASKNSKSSKPSSTANAASTDGGKENCSIS